MPSRYCRLASVGSVLFHYSPWGLLPRMAFQTDLSKDRTERSIWNAILGISGLASAPNPHGRLRFSWAVPDLVGFQSCRCFTGEWNWRFHPLMRQLASRNKFQMGLPLPAGKGKPTRNTILGASGIVSGEGGAFSFEGRVVLSRVLHNTTPPGYNKSCSAF